MTFQPPPPGDNPPPPPPPPGQWGPPPGGQPAFDPKTVNPLDWGIMGAGLLIFIFSFVSYYTYSVKEVCVTIAGHRTCAGGGGSADWNAWHGFFGWFAMLLALAGSVLVALELFMPQFKLPLPSRLLTLGAYAVALLCLILAIFVVPDYLGGGPGYDKSVNEGHGVGFWISFILVLAGTAMSLMRAQQTGTKLPGPLANIPQIGPKSGS